MCSNSIALVPSATQRRIAGHLPANNITLVSLIDSIEEVYHVKLDIFMEEVYWFIMAASQDWVDIQAARARAKGTGPGSNSLRVGL